MPSKSPGDLGTCSLATAASPSPDPGKWPGPPSSSSQDPLPWPLLPSLPGPMESSSSSSSPSGPDLYRDTWLRYLGYANEVGESFRALVPVSLVWASYGVATAYVTADAVDKGKKAAAKAPPGEAQEDVRRSTRVTLAVVDTFLWQALASVLIPGFTINRICAASLYLLGTMTRWPLSVRKWTTTALGLSAIPFIVKPIDRSVDFLMDSSLRKLYKTEEKPPTSF